MANEADKLDQAILDAHSNNDGWALSELYFEASKIKHNADDENARAFLMTQAYVFGLECGHPLTAKIHGKLVELGREAV